MLVDLPSCRRPEVSDQLALLALFGSSFLASTLLPGGSEASLLYAAYQELAPAPVLWSVATVGNSLGGLSSWVVGWWLRRYFPNRPLGHNRQRQALRALGRYGSPLLLLSWLPVVGDPLCLAAGWAGVRPLPAALFIALGKGLRYAMLLSAVGVTSG